MATPKNVSHSAGGSHAGEPHEHITPLSVYLGVFGALMVLTVVTVVISELGIPEPWNLVVAMIVAITKASLVCSVFMHLVWDKRLNTVVLLGAVFFMLVFFTLTMVDLLSRGMVDEINDQDVMLEEQKAVWQSCMDEKQDWAACKDKLPKGYWFKDPNYVEDHGGGHGGDHAKDDHAKDDHAKDAGGH